MRELTEVSQARTLLDVPDFDFDNQKFQQLSTPADLKMASATT